MFCFGINNGETSRSNKNGSLFYDSKSESLNIALLVNNNQFIAENKLYSYNHLEIESKALNEFSREAVKPHHHPHPLNQHSLYDRLKCWGDTG